MLLVLVFVVCLGVVFFSAISLPVKCKSNSFSSNGKIYQMNFYGTMNKLVNKVGLPTHPDSWFAFSQPWKRDGQACFEPCWHHKIFKWWVVIPTLQMTFSTPQNGAIFSNFPNWPFSTLPMQREVATFVAETSTGRKQAICGQKSVRMRWKNRGCQEGREYVLLPFCFPSASLLPSFCLALVLRQTAENLRKERLRNEGRTEKWWKIDQNQGEMMKNRAVLLIKMGFVVKRSKKDGLLRKLW